MVAQVGVRAVGILLGLQCTLNPFMVNPVFGEIADLPPAERARAMAEPSFRERLLAAAGDEAVRGRLGGRLIGAFDRMFVLGDPPDYEPDVATSIAAVAARAGRTPEEVAYDVLAADEGRNLLYLPFLNYAAGNLDAVGEMLVHPHTVPGALRRRRPRRHHLRRQLPDLAPRDVGPRPRPRPDRPPDHRRPPLPGHGEDGGLHDRGVLAPGYRGDLNVIDHDNLRLHRPEMHYDLPAGGKRLLQRADGYLHTFVAGVETYADGRRRARCPAASSGARPQRRPDGPPPLRAAGSGPEPAAPTRRSARGWSARRCQRVGGQRALVCPPTTRASRRRAKNVAICSRVTGDAGRKLPSAYPTAIPARPRC
jgi:hypothetical protein